jgi:hypothetical protein
MRFLFVLSASTALVACTPKVTPSAPATKSVTLVASNEAAGTAPLETQEHVQQAAGVVAVYDLKADGAKIFTTAGGDPAINGLYTYLAVFGDVETGWQIYQIGDFNDIAIVSDDGKQVGLKISKSAIKDDGNIATAESYVLVSIPAPGAKDITIAPATVMK